MDYLRRHVPYMVWTMALLAMVGSLYFQYVLHYPPCALCWYQRIFIYPLVFIIPIGLLVHDKALRYYSILLTAIGVVISVYHNLLYYNIIKDIIPCSQGVACTTRYISVLGFLDIPQLSLIALLAILVLSIFFWKAE